MPSRTFAIPIPSPYHTIPYKESPNNLILGLILSTEKTHATQTILVNGFIYVSIYDNYSSWCSFKHVSKTTIK